MKSEKRNSLWLDLNRLTRASKITRRLESEGFGSCSSIARHSVNTFSDTCGKATTREARSLNLERPWLDRVQVR